MSIKILTKTGEEITHIDDARAYNFDAGNRSGIVKGAYNEGRFYAISNVIAIDSCELRIAGHRVVIDNAESISLFNTPTTNTRYSMIAEIVVNDSSTPSFRLFIQASEINLIKQNLYKTSNGVGTYQLEIGRFTLTPSGIIEDVIRTADVITGGASDGVNNYIEIGTVTTNTISQGHQANVDVENVVDEQTGKTKTNFTFDIPATTGTTISVNGVEQNNLSFKSDPQTQLNQLSNPNLLINGDFRVNQRGKTEYNTAMTYFVDRWFMQESDLVFNVATKTLSNIGVGTKYIYQKLEDSSSLLGKILTISTKIDNVVYSSTITMPETLPTANVLIGPSVKFNKGTCYLYFYNSSKLFGLVISLNQGQSIIIDYAKLEIGSIATAFSQRPYAEELALCQRYYIKLISPILYGRTFNSDDTQGHLYCPLPTTLRTFKTITKSGTLWCFGNNSINEVTTISYGSNNINGLNLNATIAAGIGTKQAITAEGSDFEIDCEIY